MAKEIKIKLIDEKSLKFEILEHAAPGDFFSIANEENKSVILTNEWIQNVKNGFKQEVESKLKANYETQYKHQQEVIESKIERQYYTNNQKKIDELNKEIATLKERENNFNDKLKAEKASITLSISNAKQSEINKLNDEIHGLKIANNDLKHENKKIEENKKHEIENAILSTKDSLNEKIHNLTNEYNNLQEKYKKLNREKNSYNSKAKGEELEKWIENKMYEHWWDDQNVEYYKDNNASETGTKADFIFKIVDDKNPETILSSVTIEAKTEINNNDGGQKQKNESFFKKLDKDRNKNKSEYALLVTELEPNEDFVIKKIRDYENMFMIRPTYLISFLSLIRYISIQKKEIIREQIKFKNIEDILNEFNKMKDEILNNSIKNIENNIGTIVDSLNKIQKNADIIRDTITNTFQRHINTVKNKIEEFKIKKIIKKINDHNTK